MKNIIISVALILGMGLLLSTTSCSKQEPWNELEQITFDIYKEQGSAHLSVNFKVRTNEEHKIEPTKSLTLVRAEVESVTITAIDDTTSIRINGQIIYLTQGEQYTWYSAVNNKSPHPLIP